MTAHRLQRDLDWSTARGSRLRAAAGDWLVSNGHGEWTVVHDVFLRSYRRRADGRWSKHEPVHAVRVTEHVEVPTLEGPAVAEPGDWVLGTASGEMWPVTEEHFRRSYAAG